MQQLTWTGGAIQGSGTVQIATSPVVISGAGLKYFFGRTLTNPGTITWSGIGIYMTSGAVLSNPAGTTLDIQGDIGFVNYNGTLGIVSNAGLLKKSGGTGTSGLFTTLNNSGTVEVDTGTLSVSMGATNTGTFQIGAGATLAIS